GRHGSRAAARRQAHRGDRGAADGRHERGRRPVRVGQDVPAAGREVGARDEAGRRLPATFPGGGEEGLGARPEARRRQGGDAERPGYCERVRAEYVKIREAYLRGETKKTRLPLKTARDNRFKIDWSGHTPPKPKLMGTRAFKSYKLAELVPYIDWTPFFQTW